MAKPNTSPTVLKKLFAILKLVAAMLLLLCLTASLFACGEKQNTETSAAPTTTDSPAPTTTGSPTTTSAPAETTTFPKAETAGQTGLEAQLKAIETIKKLANNLHYMEYKGDYGLSGLLAQGGAATKEALEEYITAYFSQGLYRYNPAQSDGACSTISVALPQGGYGFGRNFDWQNCSAMIVKLEPADGYASVATANLDFLGFGEGFVPDNFVNKYISLAALYAPLDGMNEKGLCVAVLRINVPEETHQSTGKTSLMTTTAMRLLLDKAASVDEAIALLKQYDMHSELGMMYHLAISDAGGRSIVVEYINNVMHVTETPVVTNFFLTPGDMYGRGEETSKRRYETLTQLRKDANGVMDTKAIKEALQTVKHSLFAKSRPTQWSVVYNQASLELQFYHRENFEAPSYTYKFD